MKLLTKMSFATLLNAFVELIIKMLNNKLYFKISCIISTIFYKIVLYLFGGDSAWL